MSLSIIPVPTNQKLEPIYINQNLPHGSCVLLAPSNSGKTVFIVNAITRISFGISAHYDVIFVFSPTLDMDVNWDFVRDLPQTVVKRGRKKVMSAQIILDSEFEISKIEAILDAQEQVSLEKRKRVLIVCDDCADLLTNDKILQRLFFRGRHARVWCWLSVQSVRSIPRPIRLNSPFWVIWKVTQNELNVLASEIAVEPPAEFRRIFAEATDPKFGFLTINAKALYDQRYTASFKKITHTN